MDRALVRIALASVAVSWVLASLSALPALAGDGGGLKLPGKPGLLYQFNERQRRGVTVADDATLELRFDGCWTSKTDLVNASDQPRTISVTVQFLDENGRSLDAVPVVRGERLDGMASASINRTQCSPALAASYKLQRCWTVRRIVSAW